MNAKLSERFERMRSHAQITDFSIDKMKHFTRAGKYKDPEDYLWSSCGAYLASHREEITSEAPDVLR